ncbi:hypothetical protein [Kitasatospora sp. NPDC056184]|uniref:hypothetical protein n=1 Tax=Kitasatospora sp. NPDC056184 TaxID=3345738 RepID=UPI0035D8C149
MTTDSVETSRPSDTDAPALGPLDVHFTGVDGRQQVFSFAHLPVPALHHDLVAAFRSRCQDTRSVKTALGMHGSTARFLYFLGELDQVPGSISELTAEHMRLYRTHRSDTASLNSRTAQHTAASSLLRHVSPPDLLSHSLRTYLAQSRAAAAWDGTPEDFDPTPRIEEDPDNPLLIVFTEAGGRQRIFDLSTLEVPTLHAELAAAFKKVVTRDEGPIGLNHANSHYSALRRFLQHLAQTDTDLASVSELNARHLTEFADRIAAEVAPDTARRMRLHIHSLLGNVRPYDQLSANLRAALETTGAGIALPAVTDPVRVIPAPRPGKGRGSAMPEGPYTPDVTRAELVKSLTVTFTGEDGRSDVFNFATLPSPAFHADLASAFAVRTGPTGGLRTQSSAMNMFGCIARFLTFLTTLGEPPASLSELTVRHLNRFRLHRLQTVKELSATRELYAIRLLLREVTPSDVLSQDLRDYLRAPLWQIGANSPGVPGYSDREFRDLMSAARTEVVAIRDRIRRGERLLETFRTDPGSLTDDERTLAGHLDTMDRTGYVPVVRTQLRRPVMEGRLEIARHLFLTDSDLAPLFVLGVGLTGRNAETIKDLAADHRVLENQAVAVALTKRRRGKNKTRETVHWETGGSDSRQLHTPGGYYLLLQQLTARSRRFSASTRIWSIWAGSSGRPGPNWALKAASAGHLDPFADRLSRNLYLRQLAERHNLMDDNGKPLEISGNRIKTTVEVRTTKAMGGHLPSASRTNTLDVSFANYLRGDPVVREWADEVLVTALSDAEEHARGRTPRVLTPALSRQLSEDLDGAAADLGTTPTTLSQALNGELDTVASSCLDIENSPFSEDRCDVSFRTCLRCPNALITHQHLPVLLALTAEIEQARQSMALDGWVHEHGRTWLALTRLILPQFTDAEKTEAARAKPAPLVLDLLDGPKEA